MKRFRQWMLILIVFFLLALSGCDKTGRLQHDEGIVAAEQPELSVVSLSAGEKLNVVATTSIVADVVKLVGGDNIVLTTLVPLGADPHAFEPTPRDIAAVADAHVIFANGLGLEAFLDTLISNAGKQSALVSLSYGIHPLESAEHDEEEGDNLEHGVVDPHSWFDPDNVSVWTQNIVRALQTLDPGNALLYEQRAKDFQSELEDLKVWITEQVAQIPESNRKLVTDHQVFSYFAERYGFEQIGTVVPGYNASAQPSAQERAELERRIQAHTVEAIFVGKTVNPDLAQQLAGDMGIQLVFLYTGSLSEPDGNAASYIEFMRYNTLAIVDSLK